MGDGNLAGYDGCSQSLTALAGLTSLQVDGMGEGMILSNSELVKLSGRHRPSAIMRWLDLRSESHT